MPNKGEFIGYFIIFQVCRDKKKREKQKDRTDEMRREEKKRLQKKI